MSTPINGAAQPKTAGEFAEKCYSWFASYDPQGMEVRRVMEQVAFNNKVVLEVGCATGRTSARASLRSRAYFAIDIDARLIDFCKRKYADRSNLFFLHCDGEELLFKDALFDVVYMPWVISYFRNSARALREAARVLKNDGKLVVVNDSAHSDFDVVLEHVIEYKPHNPRQDYEEVISHNFSIEKRLGPFDVPYHFPSISEARKTFLFIVEDFFRYEKAKYDDVISAGLMRYVEKSGVVILNEKPLLYVCSKRN